MQDTIAKLLSRIKGANKKIASHAKFIKWGDTVMTHCHSGSAVSVLIAAAMMGRRVAVIATETEPKQQGIKTVRDLAGAGIPVTLITDSAVSYFMPQIDYVILGSDAMRHEGNVNKVGSLNVELAAREFRKPYYVVGSTLKIDRRKKIEIEMRPHSEVYRALKGVNISNPAFDVTPWKFVYRVVTEKGVMTPGNLMKLR